MKDDYVVVLNKHNEYWAETSVKRALRKILNDRAISIEEDKQHLLGVIKLGWDERAEYRPIYRPLIIRLSFFDYYHYKTDKVVYSDNAIFIRDNSICQYWHNYTLNKDSSGKLVRISAERHKYKCKPSELTIDHIVPISRDGKTNDFINTVCCCRYCNEIIKKNQTPIEAGLELIREPKEPRRVKGDIARAFFIFDSNKQAHKAYNEMLRKNGQTM
jgi:5-methylcytosine-specific restriction endonuclease McrA